MSTKIRDLKHLKEICKEETVDCFINLGGIRSSKAISYWPKDKDKWYVLHEIDGTEDLYANDKELLDPKNNNIGRALKAGNLYQY